MVCSGAPDTPENVQPSPARHAGNDALPASQNGLPDGTDQPSDDGTDLQHDEEQRKWKLAEQLIEQTGDNTLTLMDKGYYSLGLLNAWSQAGEHRHG